MKLSIPFYKQDKEYTCGPTSLQMVFDFLGPRESEESIARQVHATKEIGTRHEKMIEATRKKGYYCYVNNDSSISEIISFLEKKLPVIVHYTDPVSGDPVGHYAVVVRATKNELVLNDPWFGKNFKIKKRTFSSHWKGRQKSSTYTGWMMVISKEPFDLGHIYKPL